jgi:hypothetical protein
MRLIPLPPKHGHFQDQTLDLPDPPSPDQATRACNALVKGHAHIYIYLSIFVCVYIYICFFFWLAVPIPMTNMPVSCDDYTHSWKNTSHVPNHPPNKTTLYINIYSNHSSIKCASPAPQNPRFLHEVFLTGKYFYLRSLDGCNSWGPARNPQKAGRYCYLVYTLW